MTRKTLPKALTSYDFLKMAAVILMVVDHAGYYFFYETQEWWRVAGRICVPLWFFLIGYAMSRDLSWRLWGGAGLLVLSGFAAGMPVFALNVLVTILLVRILLNPLMGRALGSAQTFWTVSVALVFLALPAAFLFEYGTQGILLAMLGYMLRHPQRARRVHPGLIEQFLIFNAVTFVVIQSLGFAFSGAQMAVLMAGIMGALGVAYIFRPASFPLLTASLPGFVAAVVRFFGRRTLEIYVAHILLFRLAAMALEPERFPFMQWSWF